MSTVRASKVHKSILAPEYHLARLIANVSNPDISWKIENSAAHWMGVRLDHNSNVFELNWRHRGIKGQMFFEFLPNTVQKIRLEHNFLTGPISIGLAAEKLERAYLDYNLLSGEIILGELPRAMKHFWVRFNQCAGKLDLTTLPPMMKDLLLDGNDFSGTIFFGSLPPTLSQLFLDHNRLNGELDLGFLPQELETLSLHNNSFTGVLNFSHLPKNMRQLALARNQFKGDVDISHLSKIYFLSLFENQLMVYVDKPQVSETLKRICVYDPPMQFLQVKDLPGRITRWDTASNVWYAYEGSPPEELCREMKSNESTRFSKEQWWTPLDADLWHTFDT